MNSSQKQIVIMILTAIIGGLVGFILSRQTPSVPSNAFQMPADDGKLAKTYKEENLVKMIRENAKDLQVCYLKYLDMKPEIKEGSMNLLIKVEESGQLSEVRMTKNAFSDKNFEQCLVKKIEKFYLAPPPLGINRYISHELGFKSEETAQKEAKERQEKNRPPKILPVK